MKTDYKQNSRQTQRTTSIDSQTVETDRQTDTDRHRQTDR